MKICKTCGASLAEGVKFCGTCGTLVVSEVQAASNPSSVTHTLVISRANQFFYALGVYDVYINDSLLGRVPSGQSIALRVYSDTVEVDIKCPLPLMGNFNLWVKLKLLSNPRLEFSLFKQGEIAINVTGAQILAQGKR